ncbi:MAG: hypothetical protein DRP56_10985 [Planctomycetota bacterium]|nr:MAG: hypothetical protein DRP56_10985 [Planctomycetota bacterium]
MKFLKKLMAKENILPYSHARELASSFSILNCKADQWPFRWIGHTAMIYRDEETGSVWVYESTQSDHCNGVRLQLFSEWLRDYPGKVWLRRCTIDNKEAARIAGRQLQRHIRFFRGMPYPNLKKAKGILFLIRAAWDSVLFKKASTNTATQQPGVFFCSQLVAHAYSWAKLVTPGYVPAEFEPKDMESAPHGFEFWLRTGIKLEAGIRIK